MFTGIVQATGRITELALSDVEAEDQAGCRLVVDRAGWSPSGITLSLGDSICVSGVCLTLVAFDEATLAFDVIAQTLKLTKLGQLQVGDSVNLEPSLTMATPMGGHMVQGHVDGVGQVTAIQKTSDWRVTIRPPADLLDYVVPRGGIAIDGVSLTLADVDANAGTFEIALIPTTLASTTLGDLAVGDTVNLETDIVSKTIVHWLRRQSEQTEKTTAPPITMDTLRTAGFG